MSLHHTLLVLSSFLDANVCTLCLIDNLAVGEQIASDGMSLHDCKRVSLMTLFFSPVLICSVRLLHIMDISSHWPLVDGSSLLYCIHALVHGGIFVCP